MGKRELTRVRSIALALPNVNERISHRAPCFFIGQSVAFCRYHDDHRGDGRISLWCRPPLVLRDALISSDAERFFKPVPSASGTFGDWLGVFLDPPKFGEVNWAELANILADSYRHVAPKKFIEKLDAG